MIPTLVGVFVILSTMQPRRTQHEQTLHTKVAWYLRHNYPNVIFRTDFAAGIKMTMGQAVKHKALQSSRAYPDLFIAYPTEEYHGLFIELKADNAKVYLKDGTLSKEKHIQEQEAMLDRLRALGYRASFAKGFDQAKELIDDYIGLVEPEVDSVVF